MGRIFEKRKDRMFARWSKNAKAFTKVGKEVAIAVKLGGGDPATNPRLRMAIQTARSLNMPKDRIEAAVKRASSKDTVAVDEITYEAFAPHGIALMIDAATDNPTRTVANIRSILTRWNGSLAATGSVEYLFERRGVIIFSPPTGDLEEFELGLIDHGLEDLAEGEDGLIAYSTFAQFIDLQRALESKGVEIKGASLQRIPKTPLAVTPAHAEEAEKIIGHLEEDDDVQHVYHNMDQSEG